MWRTDGEHKSRTGVTKKLILQNNNFVEHNRKQEFCRTQQQNTRNSRKIQKAKSKLSLENLLLEVFIFMYLSMQYKY